MYVACPSCHALYPVSAEHLRLAGGRVRCGACRKVFDAGDGVFDTPQQAVEYVQTMQPDLAVEIDELVGRALEQVEGDTAPVASDAEAVAGQRDAVAQSVAESIALAEAALDDIDARNAPAESPGANAVAGPETPAAASVQIAGPPGGHRADTDHYAHPVSSEFSARVAEAARAQPDLSMALLLEDPIKETHTAWGAIVMTLLLIGTALLQYAYLERFTLAESPALRPGLEFMCDYLACELPLRRDIAQVEMIEREVRDHPQADNALMIKARFANRADFAQAYPVLQVSFSDVSGRRIAARRFRPEEYLEGSNVVAGMAPGEQTRVRLEIVDPGSRAVSYQFDFM